MQKTSHKCQILLLQKVEFIEITGVYAPSPNFNQKLIICHRALNAYNKCLSLISLCSSNVLLSFMPAHTPIQTFYLLSMYMKSFTLLFCHFHLLTWSVIQRSSFNISANSYSADELKQVWEIVSCILPSTGPTLPSSPCLKSE